MARDLKAEPAQRTSPSQLASLSPSSLAVPVAHQHSMLPPIASNNIAHTTSGASIRIGSTSGTGGRGRRGRGSSRAFATDFMPIATFHEAAKVYQRIRTLVKDDKPDKTVVDGIQVWCFDVLCRFIVLGAVFLRRQQCCCILGLSMVRTSSHSPFSDFLVSFLLFPLVSPLYLFPLVQIFAYARPTALR